MPNFKLEVNPLTSLHYLGSLADKVNNLRHPAMHYTCISWQRI